MKPDEKPVVIYLHFSDNSPSEEGELQLSDGDSVPVIWKDVLVEGEYPLTPGSSGAIKRKLTVTAEGESSREKNIVSMSDLIDSHDDGAFKYVTIPTSHRDGSLDNTGYVPRPKGLRVVDKEVEGKSAKVMQAALGFTEPDVKGKVQRGTIPDCSAGIFFDWLNKHKNKRYRVAMKHVALTPTPFMGNLAPFKAVFASDEEIDSEVQIQHFMFDEDGTSSESGSTGDNSGATTGEIVWHQKNSVENTRQQIDGKLNPRRSEGPEDVPVQPRPSYYVRDISHDSNALVEEYFKGDQRRYVIPFTRNEDGTVDLAPATRWVETQEAMIAASDQEFDKLAADSVKSKLDLALADMFGSDADKFGIEALTLDRRVKVVNKATAAEYVASFAMLADDSVVIEPTAEWERTKAPTQTVKPVDSKVELSDTPKLDLSTPRGRLEAARQQRANR